MKVIILCGGMGTRLREATETLPKPMVEIGGKPILWHIMKQYAHYGFTDFILCLGYKGHTIKEYFLNYEAMNCDFTVELGHGKPAFHSHASRHDEEGWKITLVDTGENTMTGARIKRASKYLGDDEIFAVTYGDGVSDVKLSDALALHNREGRLGTLTGVRPPSRFGELGVEGTLVKNFREKPTTEQGLINGGFFFFKKEFLNYLSEDRECILEREPLERCVADGQMTIMEHSGFWQCMDTFRDWQLLEKLWSEGKAPWKVWT